MCILFLISLKSTKTIDTSKRQRLSDKKEQDPTKRLYRRHFQLRDKQGGKGNEFANTNTVISSYSSS